MGGKAKQANRTKNNVRPSSSGRSAELITTKVNPSLVLVGPGKLLPTIFPSLNSAAQDCLLSNEFLLAFKKFNKKDPITKIKALNELKDLVVNGKQEEVENSLQSWAHYYPSLTVDIDRKVRETTQICHGEIVRRCGRKVAPQLRRLLPAWLLACHDEHAPAQSAAHAQLQATFPNEKLAEAIKFCKTEIFNLLLDNLKGNSYMLTGQKIEKEEERRAQAARVIGCSLRALGPPCALLPDELDEWLWDTLAPLLCANSFWQLPGHEDAFVRWSWYEAAGVLATRLAARLPRDTAKRAARALLQHPDKDALAAGARWAALLAFIDNVEDWATLIDTKLLVKRLLDLLENAAWGEARKLSAIVLQLLSRLPDDILTQKFYENYFEAMFKGLEQKAQARSKHEASQWSGAIAASARAAAARCRAAPYAAELAAGVARGWARRALPAPRLAAPAAAHAARLLAHWLQEDGDDRVYDAMVQKFWAGVSSTMLQQIDEVAEEEAAALLHAHALFLDTFRAGILPPRPPRAVRFADDGGDDGDASDAAEELRGDAAARERLSRELRGAARAAAARYLSAARRGRGGARALLPRLVPLLREYHSRDLFLTVAAAFEVSESQPILGIYMDVVRDWISEESQRCPAAVELVFLLLQHLTEPEQDAVFCSFDELSEEVLEWCVRAALAPEHRGGASAARWLRSGGVTRAVVALARRAADPSARDTLLTALAPAHDHEAAISDEAIGSLLDTCTGALNELMAHDPEITLPAAPACRCARAARRAAPCRCSRGGGGGGAAAEAEAERAPVATRVTFAARAVRLLAPRAAARSGPLLLSLFRLNLHLPRESTRLGAGEWSAARAAWRRTAAALPAQQRDAFTTAALRHVRHYLRRDMETLNIQRIEHMASLCPDLVLADDELPVDATRSALVALSEHVLGLEAFTKPKFPLAVFALQMDVLWGNMSCPFEDDNDLIEAVVEEKLALNKETLVPHASQILFRALYLKAVLVGQHADRVPNVALLMDEYFLEQFCNVLHDCVVLNALHEHYAFWRHYDIICETKERMDDIVKSIVVEISEADTSIATSLADKSETHGHYWTWANEYYKKVVLQAKNERELAKDEDDDEGSSDSCSDFEIVNAEQNVSAQRSDLQVIEDEIKGKTRKPSYLRKAAKLKVNVVSKESNVVQYVDMLGDLVLDSAFYHQMQMKAAFEMRDKQRAIEEKIQTQEGIVAEVDPMGDLKVPENWSPVKPLDEEPWFSEEVARARDLVMLRCFYCEYAAAAPSVDRFILDVATLDKCSLDAVIDGYHRHNATLLYDRRLTDTSWRAACASAGVLDALGAAAEARGWDAPAAHWDFTNLTLCALLAALAASAPDWRDTRVALVSRATLQLYCSVRRFVRSVPARAQRRRPSAHVAALPREWDDVFAADAAAHLCTLLCHVLESCSSEVTASEACTVRWLLEAARHADRAGVARALRAGAAAGAQEGAGAVSLQRAVRAATRCLTAPAHRVYKYLAYHTLCMLSPASVREDEARMWRFREQQRRSESAGEDVSVEAPQLTLAWLDEPFDQLQELVDAVLSEYVEFEDTCELVVASDSHSVALGYLLLALAMLRQCERATGDVALEYLDEFSTHPYTEGLLPAALRLLPPAVVAYAAAASPALPRRYLPWFEGEPDLCRRGAWAGDAVPRLACAALFGALGAFGGGGARAWWDALRPRPAAAAARLAAAAAAPALVAAQLLDVKRHENDFGPDVKVTVCTPQRWATCTLVADGAECCLRVQYAAAHPLHAPRVHAPPAGPAAPNARLLAMHLERRGARARDVVSMWVSAAGRGRGGTDHCFVCYLHVDRDELPTDPDVPTYCPQCRNFYHLHCMRRWFHCSSRSTCPLCRTKF